MGKKRMFSFKYIKCIIKCTVCPCLIRLKAILLSWSINQPSRLTKIYLKFISPVLYIIVNGKRDIYLQIKHQIKQYKFRPCPHVSGYIFESATFSFGCKNFDFHTYLDSNQICPSTRIYHVYPDSL